MSWLDLSVLYVAATLMGEAGTDTEPAMHAVGETIVVRAKERKLLPIEVVTQKSQYSCWNKGSKHLLARVPKWREQRPDRWTDAVALATEIVYGKFPVSERRFNHYYNPRLCRPWWRARLRDKTTIGKHIFGRIGK